MVSSEGNSRAPVAVQRIGERLFLNAKQAGELYGGQIYWYPVSGRVQMSFRGGKVQLLAGSQEATLEGEPVSLEAPVLLRAAQAYVPLSFFLGEPFARLAGMDSRFDEPSRLLTIERRCNLGAVRWFSYQDYTRIVIELKKPLGHTLSARRDRVEMTIPFGLVEGPEEGRIADGLIEEFNLRQESKLARLSVRLSRAGLFWRARELSDPPRLALEISAAEFSPDSATADEKISSAPASVVVSSNSSGAAVAEKSAAAPVFNPPSASAADERPRRLVVIDAGHGGKDSGASSRRGTREKDINLSAAKELAKLLAQEEIFEVLLTRDDDTFVPLDARSRMANDKRADIFISLHCNSHRNKKEDGFEVYFVSETASDPEAERLAEYENSSLALEGKSPQDGQAELILHALTKGESINAASELAALAARDLNKRVDMKNRGVKQAAFYVLRGTDAPAILVEMGFLSNRRDEQKISSRRFRRRIVDGLYAGLVDYAVRKGWLQKGLAHRSGK